MILADSNLIIYAIAQNNTLVDWFAEEKPVVSAVSLVEVLGYHKLSTEDKSANEIGMRRWGDEGRGSYGRFSTINREQGTNEQRLAYLPKRLTVNP